jgi:transcriptional regulator with XRE-family HTH domain
MESTTEGVEQQLRDRIQQLLAAGETLAGIAGRAGVDTSPTYRWWRGDQSLKLGSFERLCRAAGMRLATISAETESKGRKSKGSASIERAVFSANAAAMAKEIENRINAALGSGEFDARPTETKGRKRRGAK